MVDLNFNEIIFVAKFKVSVSSDISEYAIEAIHDT